MKTQFMQIREAIEVPEGRGTSRKSRVETYQYACRTVKARVFSEARKCPRVAMSSAKSCVHEAQVEGAAAADGEQAGRGSTRDGSPENERGSSKGLRHGAR